MNPEELKKAYDKNDKWFRDPINFKGSEFEPVAETTPNYYTTAIATIIKHKNLNIDQLNEKFNRISLDNLDSHEKYVKEMSEFLEETFDQPGMLGENDTFELDYRQLVRYYTELTFKPSKKIPTGQVFTESESDLTSEQSFQAKPLQSTYTEKRNKQLKKSKNVTDYETLKNYLRGLIKLLPPSKFELGSFLATSKKPKSKDPSEPRNESKVNALRQLLAEKLDLPKRIKSKDDLAHEPTRKQYFEDLIMSLGADEENLFNAIVKAEIQNIKQAPDNYNRIYPNLKLEINSMGRPIVPGEPLTEPQAEDSFEQINTSATDVSRLEGISFQSQDFKPQALSPAINFTNLYYIYQALYDDPEMPDRVIEIFNKIMLPVLNEVYIEDDNDPDFIKEYVRPIYIERIQSISEFIVQTIENDYVNIIDSGSKPEEFKKIINKITDQLFNLVELIRKTENIDINKLNNYLVKTIEYAKNKYKLYYTAVEFFPEDESFTNLLKNTITQLTDLIRTSLTSAREEKGIGMLNKSELDEKSAEDFEEAYATLKNELVKLLDINFSPIQKEKINSLLTKLDQNIGSLGEYYKKEKRNQKRIAFQEKQSRQSVATRADLNQAEAQMTGTAAIMNLSAIAEEPENEQEELEAEGNLDDTAEFVSGDKFTFESPSKGPKTVISGNFVTDSPTERKRSLSEYSAGPSGSRTKPSVKEIIGEFDPAEKAKWKDYQDMTAEDIIIKLLTEYEYLITDIDKREEIIAQLQVEWASVTNKFIPLRAPLPQTERKTKASDILISSDTEGRVYAYLKGFQGKFEQFTGYSNEQLVDILFDDVQELKQKQLNLVEYQSNIVTEIDIERQRKIAEQNIERRRSVTSAPNISISNIFNVPLGFLQSTATSVQNILSTSMNPALQKLSPQQRRLIPGSPLISTQNIPVVGANPALPAMRDDRPTGSQGEFAYNASYDIENLRKQIILPNQVIDTYDEFEQKLNNLNISWNELSSDTRIAKNIVRIFFAQRRNDAELQRTIKIARKSGAFPFVYKPKYGDTTTQQLKNIAFLPDAKTQGRIVNSDLGTVIIPGQSNYTLRREGLNYVVHSAGKKQTFGSAKDASYFVSSGGFGRKTYGPVTERVFGYPTKNLSQAIY